MPLISTRGAASAQGFGEFAQSAAPVYIEDVFSTYLYTGNGSTQTITNGIDLSGKGGLVWAKARSAAQNNVVYDTSRGPGTSTTAANQLRTDSSSGVINTQTSGLDYLSAFNSNGFSVVSGGGNIKPLNENTTTYASWTFRKQAKFFDVVTWTGNGSTRTISHNLGSVPGCIIVKRTDTTGNWAVYHRSLANTEWLVLNDTTGKLTDTTLWNSTTATSANFSLGTSSEVNANGGTYVAYIFAHNAGGFGLSGSDNVISCGSYTTSSQSDSPIISLGYEPQLVLVKLTNVAGDWRLFDNMRGAATGGIDALLRPNSSAAELSAINYITFNSTGFQQSPDIDTGANSYIYIAIRRGPMKVPISGTSVFSPVATSSGTTRTTNFITDAAIIRQKDAASDWAWGNRLFGWPYLSSNLTAVESTGPTNAFLWDSNTSYVVNLNGNLQNINYAFRRAPGFFDVVCYTGTGANRTVAHNLTVVPELIIAKGRNIIAPWEVYSAALANTQYMVLNTTAAVATGATRWNSTTPTSSVFSLGTSTQLNTSGSTYVAYLFATAPGVSKVGSYTGNGSSQTIACGFTAGSRFVMIKRTDSTGDWYVWDSARGIVAGNDPHLSLNTTAAEVTTDDSVDTDSSGFIVNQLAATNVNVSSATYIFLAIA